MTPKQSTGHDGFVSDADINDLKDEINRGKFKEIVCDLIIKEPDLGTAVSLRYQKFVAMLQGASMSIEQRMMIDKHVCLSIWMPLIALARSHRRAWDDFLPQDNDDQPLTTEEK
jgi:hypothetical protein